MRPRFAALQSGLFLTHAELLSVATLNAELDQVERARRRIESQLRRGVPIEPKVVEPMRVA